MSWIDTRDPTTLAYAIFAYACLLATLLAVINLLLNRLTRDERDAERRRRRQSAATSHRDAR